MSNTYADVHRTIRRAVEDHSTQQKEVVAYMFMRAAVLLVADDRGRQNAAALAYKLADEMATTL